MRRTRTLRFSSGLLALALAAGLGVAGPVGVSAQGTDASAGADKVPRYTPVQVGLRLAYYTKLLADEIFLLSRGGEDDRAARDRYAEAREILEGRADQLTSDDKITYDLLMADIKYRLTLLDAGADFWGGSLSRSPTLPATHLAAMGEALQSFEALNAEIVAAERAVRGTTLQGMFVRADTRAIEGELRKTLPESDRLNAVEDDNRDRVATVLSQISDMQALQKQLAEKQKQLYGQLQSAKNAVNEALINGVAALAGVPAEVKLLAKEGALEERLLDYVVNQNGAILTNPAVADALTKLEGPVEEFRTAFASIKDNYDQAKAIVDQGQDALRAAENIGRLLRDPTLDTLLEAGQAVSQSLGKDDPLVREWRGVVERAKPYKAALDALRTGASVDEVLRGKMNEAVAGFLADTPMLSDLVKQAADRLVTANKDAAQRWYAGLLNQTLSLELSDEARAEVVRLVMRAWPSKFLAAMPPAARQRLIAQVRERVGIGSEREAAAYVQSKLANFGVNVREGRVFVEFDGRVANVGSLADFAGLPSAGALEASVANVEREIRDGIQRLAAREGDLRRGIVRGLPLPELEKMLGEAAEMSALKGAGVWDGIVSRLPSAQGEALLDRLTATQVGAVVVGYDAVNKAAGSSPTRAFNPDAPNLGVPSSGDATKDAIMREAARQALNAALPGAGEALEVARAVLNGMAEMDRLAGEINRSTQEIGELAQREVLMYGTLDESRRALAVLRADREVAAIQRQTALARYRAMMDAGAEVGRQTTEERLLIQNRQPLAFYLAEQLRRHYDALDRSLALWLTGSGNTRGTIERLVREDPQNLRLALDRDIHLYEWLDRSRERDRTNIDTLLAHWRQLHRLARDVCAQVGCLPGNARLGNVQQTAAVSIGRLMTASEKDRFRAWLRQPAGAFVTTLTVAPSSGLVPDHLLNVRFVDARVGVKVRGQVEGTGAVTLYHPGVGFVRRGGIYEREVFRPAPVGQFHPPEPFDVGQLADRAHDPRASRKDLEGYALYAAMRVRIEPDVIPPNIEDVLIRIAYYFQLPTASQAEQVAFFDQDRARVPTRRAVTRVTPPTGGSPVDVPLDARSLVLIGDERTFEHCRRVWLGEASSGQAGESTRIQGQRRPGPTQRCGLLPPSSNDEAPKQEVDPSIRQSSTRAIAVVQRPRAEIVAALRPLVRAEAARLVRELDPTTSPQDVEWRLRTFGVAECVVKRCVDDEASAVVAGRRSDAQCVASRLNLNMVIGRQECR